MTTEITKKAENGTSFEDMHKMSVLLVKSGFLPQAIKTPEQALTIMLTGKELGLGFMESLRSINVVQGKPCMSAQLLLGLCYRTGQVEKASFKEETALKCVFILQRKGSPEYVSTFTIEDAKRMNLAGKDNWVKQPTTMLKWRAVSAACRIVFPDAISGVYTPEEIQDNLPEVVAEPEQVLSPSDQNAQIKGDDIPDSELGNWVMPLGKYQEKRLIEIIGEVTETGKAKGYEYLQWLAENGKNPEYTGIIKRFLTVIDKEK